MSFTIDREFSINPYDFASYAEYRAALDAVLSAVTTKDSRAYPAQRKAYNVKAAGEDVLQASIERILAEYQDVMVGYVKRGKAIPQSVYNDMSAELQAVLEEHLSKVYIGGALTSQAALSSGVAIGIDWAAPNVNAMAWAKQYTFDLVRGLEDTTKTQVAKNIANLQRDVSAFFGKPTTLGQLRGQIGKYIPDWEDRLGHVWASPVRAEMIAITETTRASVEGQADSVAYLKDYGIEMVAVFQTSNDEHVCRICGPLNEKRVEPKDYPPLHPRCRCGVSFELKQ